MTRRRLLAAAGSAALVAVLVAGVLFSRGTGPAVATPASSSPPLAFSGPDVLAGDRIDLADFAGKPVVINIWASWCSGCNAEADELGAFAKAHPEAAFVGIDFQDSVDGARAFYDRYDWTFPSIADPEGTLAFDLGLQGTPTTIFLDADHREVARIVGETDETGFAQGLAAATASS